MRARARSMRTRRTGASLRRLGKPRNARDAGGRGLSAVLMRRAARRQRTSVQPADPGPRRRDSRDRQRRGRLRRSCGTATQVHLRRLGRGRGCCCGDALWIGACGVPTALQRGRRGTGRRSKTGGSEPWRSRQWPTPSTRRTRSTRRGHWCPAEAARGDRPRVAARRRRSRRRVRSLRSRRSLRRRGHRRGPTRDITGHRPPADGGTRGPLHRLQPTLRATTAPLSAYSTTIYTVPTIPTLNTAGSEHTIPTLNTETSMPLSPTHLPSSFPTRQSSRTPHFSDQPRGHWMLRAHTSARRVDPRQKNPVPLENTPDRRKPERPPSLEFFLASATVTPKTEGRPTPELKNGPVPLRI